MKVSGIARTQEYNIDTSLKRHSSGKKGCQVEQLPRWPGINLCPLTDQVRRRSDGSVFAMKCVNKSRVSGSRTDLRHTRTERDVLARVTAAMKSPVQQPPPPFLVGLESAFETRHRLYLVQEFCRGGELFRLMEEERMFLEDEAR